MVVLVPLAGSAGKHAYPVRNCSYGLAICTEGMPMCDTQSFPEFTHAPCAPDSDTNVFDGTDPSGADYIGHHPGTAFMEMQFYPAVSALSARYRTVTRRMFDQLCTQGRCGMQSRPITSPEISTA